MTSISFPSPSMSPSDNRPHDDGFYAPGGFDASSSFQMNPLSSHPPRTPRTSIISNLSHTFQSSAFETQEEQEEHISAEDIDLDEEEDKVKEAEKRVLKEEIWKDIVLTSNGRDKAFKLIQYSIRVYLLFHASIASSRLLRRPKNIKWEIDIVQRLQSTASGFSFTRKLLLLFNWLQPLTVIRSQQMVPFSSESSLESSKKQQRSFLQTALYAPPPVLLEFVNAIADDVATFSRLGLLGKRLGDKAARFSDWCWLMATLVGLVENGVERQIITSLQSEVEGRMYKESMSNGGASAKSKPKVSKIDEKELSKLARQDYWLQVTRAKLVMDLIFVSYELFNFKRGRDSVKAFTGLAAAVLSSAKLYEKHKTSLLKSMISSSS